MFGPRWPMPSRAKPKEGDSESAQRIKGRRWEERDKEADSFGSGGGDGTKLPCERNGTRSLGRTVKPSQST